MDPQKSIIILNGLSYGASFFFDISIYLRDNFLRGLRAPTPK